MCELLLSVSSRARTTKCTGAVASPGIYQIVDVPGLLLGHPLASAAGIDGCGLVLHPGVDPIAIVWMSVAEMVGPP